MTSKERRIERLLAQAHDAAWAAGRFDVCTPIVAAINVLRRLSPRPLPDSRNELERDRDDAESGVAN
jgi:hypothetical protein